MAFKPDRDIPDVSAKVIIVTGGSSGLGKESVHQLAKHNPSLIFLGARTAQRGHAAIKEIELDVPSIKGRLKFLQIDLSSFESIKKAADSFMGQADRLDILMNNAGVMAQPEGLTEDGYEIQFGANYMGPALFTRLLLPLLQKTSQNGGSDVRVVNLSSELYRQAPAGGLLLEKAKTTLSDISSLERYGQSKLADFYGTLNLARKYSGIKFVAVHPGVVKTGLFDDLKRRRPYLGALVGFLSNLLLTDVHNGARTQLWAATSPVPRSGGFYNPSQKEYESSMLKDEELAKRLQDWTEAEFRKVGL